ncbi:MULTISPECIES: class I SAM-dependent methyltransferase [unclassified Microcystis]|jgi:ubiquinone/menaquinone biosynthesis C-methylase UbiE|uniref:class I SAM-dependent methyltransferase n=1 Tax=unclassified Microcystis TaxID=2643300 RepID=UPI0022CA45DA|nr:MULTISPECIES: class I SAM-dependent methyltransferase [unclassified Microcystis]MCA2694472.1 class I SAM-dependent methyltransferase [Microcystis sp. M034S2]MCA2749614.1 class I SAM-dependent methyltransferase [Microcystis sp. M144S2]MCZ8200254.1 class I SAM-dependent methyltransferase [Microcystis sp. LE19-55.1A]MCZ8305608.1 class I SAM-dependent methyltransferase [Microcystis sp. LE19-98.1E]
MLKEFYKEMCPPLFLKTFALLRVKLSRILDHYVYPKNQSSGSRIIGDNGQDLEIYWNPDMAEILDTWGEGNAWNELEFLMVNCRGKVLDIACGTGKNIETLSKFPPIEVYGCDISDFLIKKALDRGIPEERLKICDATKTDYHDNSFNYSYSIGSLEHFTENGIVQFVAEAYRITQYSSFHMIPVSRSGKDEGWIKTLQSFHNNSVNWWLNKYKSSYQSVFVIDSSWQDDISVGKWFICIKNIEKF